MILSLPRNAVPLDELIRRFWSRVLVNENGCWLYTGDRNHDGYGRMAKTYGLVRVYGERAVHRMAWTLWR